MQHKMSFLIYILIKFALDLGFRVYVAFRYVLNKVIALELKVFVDTLMQPSELKTIMVRTKSRPWQAIGQGKL